MIYIQWQARSLYPEGRKTNGREQYAFRHANKARLAIPSKAGRRDVMRSHIMVAVGGSVAGVCVAVKYCWLEHV